KRKRLIGQLHRFMSKPRFGGVLLSESVTQMNDCPRCYTLRKRLIGQFHLFMSKPRFGGVLLSESVTQMNDCPRRYTQKKAAYR
ncbi:TPA: hypothetical protein ACWL7N_000912, partial [Klebsiella quasipneumoniae]